MTRDEEIRQYLKERNIPITSLEANSIIEGIKWADEHPNLSEEEQVENIKLWIARDRDGDLYLYPSKPRKGDYRFVCGYVFEDYINLSSDEFPEVTFENSPQEVELKLVSN